MGSAVLTNQSLTQKTGSAFPRLRAFSLSLFAIVCLLWAYSLGRYPAFYCDDSYYVYAGLRAYMGGPFAYPITLTAPYGNLLWAYAGPLHIHLENLLFHLFGFSILMTRLPNFLGGWLAVTLIVLWLFRRGYTLGGCLLAILWCGDRAPLEMLYGRMDGLALLLLVLTFLTTEHALRKPSRSFSLYGLLAGIFGGLTLLTNPVCVVAIGSTFLLTLFLRRFRISAAMAVGLLLSLPLVFPLLDGHLREAYIQFQWSRSYLKGTAFGSLLQVISVLQWSKFWAIALVLFSVLILAVTAWQILRRRIPLDSEGLQRLLCATFVLGGLPAFIHSGTRPYYLIYFSLWPMLYLAMMVDRNWSRPAVKAIFALMLLAWLPSAAWQAMRLRESIKFHDALSLDTLQQQIAQNVPADATLLTSPDLYAVPFVTGHPNSHPLPWYEMESESCPDCYVLIDREDLAKAPSDPRLGLANRHVLYSGPAFPSAGPLREPVLLLSPEQLTH
jgi:hypothetical protein